MAFNATLTNSLKKKKIWTRLGKRPLKYEKKVKFYFIEILLHLFAKERIIFKYKICVYIHNS